MVEILVSFWDGPFSGAMLVSGRAKLATFRNAAGSSHQRRVELPFPQCFHAMLLESCLSSFIWQFQTWPFWDGENVTLSEVIRDLQRSGMKRSLWITWFIWCIHYPPRKTNMTGWIIHHEWRCISYWAWVFGTCHVGELSGVYDIGLK